MFSITRLVTLLLLAQLTINTGCSSQRKTSEKEVTLDLSRASSIVHNDPAVPRFSLPDTGGKTVSLDSFRGKVVLLHFWATWCHTCLDEIRALDLIYKKYQDQGFVVVAVAIDDSLPKLQQFQRDYQIQLPILVDTDQVVKKNFNLLGLPIMQALDRSGRLTSLIDPESGQITERVSGVREWSSKSGLKSIEQLLRRHSQR